MRATALDAKALTLTSPFANRYYLRQRKVAYSGGSANPVPKTNSFSYSGTNSSSRPVVFQHHGHVDDVPIAREVAIGYHLVVLTRPAPRDDVQVPVFLQVS